MSYMIMLVLENSAQLKPVLQGWQALGVDEITFIDSTCAHLHASPKVHIPIRFMFEPVSGDREACTLTVFAIVPDEANVHMCIAAAEEVVGDLDHAPTAMVAAWPLTIVKGFPRSSEKRI